MEKKPCESEQIQEIFLNLKGQAPSHCVPLKSVVEFFGYSANYLSRDSSHVDFFCGNVLAVLDLGDAGKKTNCRMVRSDLSHFVAGIVDSL